MDTNKVHVRVNVEDPAAPKPKAFVAITDKQRADFFEGENLLLREGVARGNAFISGMQRRHQALGKAYCDDMRIARKRIHRLKVVALPVAMFVGVLLDCFMRMLAKKFGWF